MLQVGVMFWDDIVFCNLLTVCVYIPSTNPNSNPVEVVKISSNLKFRNCMLRFRGFFLILGCSLSSLDRTATRNRI